MAEEGQVISCHTADKWTEYFNKGKESKKLVVVDFTASWCGPCKFIAPILAECAKKNPQALFLKVDVDELPDVAKKYEIKAMPTFIFMKDGAKIADVVGAQKDELLSTIAKHSDGTAATSSVTPAL